MGRIGIGRFINTARIGHDSSRSSGSQPGRDLPTCSGHTITPLLASRSSAGARSFCGTLTPLARSDTASAFTDSNRRLGALEVGDYLYA